MSGKINSHILFNVEYTKVFIMQSNIADKEIIYYKI